MSRTNFRDADSDHSTGLRHCGPTKLCAWICVLGVSLLPGCGRSHPPPPGSHQPTTAKPEQGSLIPKIALAQPNQRLGTAIVVLIDTSGSMNQPIRNHAGQQQPKNVIAQAALS